MNVGLLYNSFEKITGIESELINTLDQLQKIDSEIKYYSVGGQSSHIDIPHVGNKILMQNNIMPKFELKNKNIEIVHSFFPAFAHMMLPGVKYFITINDLIPLSHPDWFPETTNEYFKTHIKRSVEKADVVFAISEATKRDILYYYDVPEEKIRVTLLGNNYKFTEKVANGIENKFSLDRFILSVCTLEPRKNLRGLISAFVRYKEHNPDDSVKLVLAGGKGWDYEFENFLNSLGSYKEEIIITGYVSDYELSDLYRMALGVAYVSFYEGFGLPILEALCQGKAVVCSNTSSMPEVGGDAVCYCNPYETASIEIALKNILQNNDYRRELERKAIEQASKFSYVNTAKIILEAYKEFAK